MCLPSPLSRQRLFTWLFLDPRHSSQKRCGELVSSQLEAWGWRSCYNDDDEDDGNDGLLGPQPLTNGKKTRGFGVILRARELPREIGCGCNEIKWDIEMGSTRANDTKRWEHCIALIEKTTRVQCEKRIDSAMDLTCEPCSTVEYPLYIYTTSVRFRPKMNRRFFVC